eukprot:Pgem_evm1s8375
MNSKEIIWQRPIPESNDQQQQQQQEQHLYSNSLKTDNLNQKKIRAVCLYNYTAQHVDEMDFFE